MIKKFEIIKYKCFNDFTLEGLSRINVISGKNNVGKTAFMEAVCINVYSTSISLMTNVLSSPKLAREFLEIGYRVLLQDERKDFLESIKNYSSTSNINNIEFKIIEDSGIKEYFFHFDNKSMKININDFSYEKTKKNNIKFLTQLGFTKYQLKQVFESVQKKDVENILYEYIKNFDNNILNFKIIGGDKPQCKINTGEYRDINEFGDGLKHWISIICSLYACENGYLFIDELDNGIHYTQLDKLWEIILTISKQQNVQVFATTHSKECIESYARVAKRLEDEGIGFIELGRNKNNELDAVVMDSEMFQRFVKLGNEVRGW
jgi:AAA15 family ATPase/GTPase